MCFLQTLESQKQSIEVDYKKGYQITEHKAILGGTLESLLSDKPSYKAGIGSSLLGPTKNSLDLDMDHKVKLTNFNASFCERVRNSGLVNIKKPHSDALAASLWNAYNLSIHQV